MAGTFTTRTINITTGSTETLHDLTNACSAFLREAAHGRNGLLNIFTPHAMSGLAIIETGAGSDDVNGGELQVPPLRGVLVTSSGTTTTTMPKVAGALTAGTRSGPPIVADASAPVGAGEADRGGPHAHSVTEDDCLTGRLT